MKFIILVFIMLISIGCRRDLDGDYSEKLKGNYVGYVSVDVSADKNLIRTQETLLGNMVTDALSYYMLSEGKKVDIAFVNSGGIRYTKENREDGVYKAGDYTEATVDEIFPFGNQIMKVIVTGKQLKQIMEHSVSSLPAAEGKFLQISKELRVEIDITKQPEVLSAGDNPVIETEGERIISMKINNEDYSPSKTYTIAVSDYVGNGGDGFVVLGKINESYKTLVEKDIKLSLIKYISEYSPILPELDGRIKITGE